MILVLMGVSGSGKSTIGALLAERLSTVFVDADEYHPIANKQKMASGLPLNDEDRQPWLDALNHLLLGWFEREVDGVLACSSLKERYRTALTAGVAPRAVAFVLLEGDKQTIAERLAARSHEFMNATLLTSQLEALERPAEALIVRNDREPIIVVEEILRRLGTGLAYSNRE